MGRELGHRDDVRSLVYSMDSQYVWLDWIELPESGMAL